MAHDLVMTPTLLAETISLSKGETMFLVIILLGIVAVFLVICVLSCVWAYRSGRGSKNALVGWILTGVVQLLLLSVFTSLVILLIGVQAGLYFLGRHNARPPAAPTT